MKQSNIGVIAIVACATLLVSACAKSTPADVSSSQQSISRPVMTDMTDPNGPGGIEFDVTAVIPLTPIVGGYQGTITDANGNTYFLTFGSQFEYLLNTCGAPANGTITKITDGSPTLTWQKGPVSGIYTITMLTQASGSCAIGATQTAATAWENATSTWGQNYSQAYQTSPSTITQWLNSNPEPNYTNGYLGPTMQAQCNEALGDLGTSVAQVTNFKTVVYSYKNGVPQFAIVSPYWIFKGTSCGL